MGLEICQMAYSDDNDIISWAKLGKWCIQQGSIL